MHVCTVTLDFFDAVEIHGRNFSLLSVRVFSWWWSVVVPTLNASRALPSPDLQSFSRVFISPWRKKYLILLLSCCASKNECIFCRVLFKSCQRLLPPTRETRYTLWSFRYGPALLDEGIQQSQILYGDWQLRKGLDGCSPWVEYIHPYFSAHSVYRFSHCQGQLRNS